MTRTRFLLALLVVVVLLQVYPEKSAAIELAAVTGAALLAAIWAGARYRNASRRRGQGAALATADAAEYRDYEAALTAIRAKYGVELGTVAPPEVAAAFQAELATLHDRHAAMLARKFGEGKSL